MWAAPDFSLASAWGVDSLRGCASAPCFSALSRPELEALLVELFGEIAALKQVVVELREENARLKGLKERPKIGPSGMDKGTEPAKPNQRANRRGRGKVTPRVEIEEQVVNAPVPPGSRFKGYEPFLVQDLVISVRATCYQRERWTTPANRSKPQWCLHNDITAHRLVPQPKCGHTGWRDRIRPNSFRSRGCICGLQRCKIPQRLHAG